jgi:archaemetzincin
MGPEAPVEALQLLPLGAFPEPLGAGMVTQLSRSVRVPCRLLPPDPRLALPRLPGRSQVDADGLLRLLEGLPREPGAVLVGLTDADIGHPIFTFFFGRARLGGGALLVSLARLDPTFYGLPADPALTVRRAIREVLHELGHVVGLRHCERPDCLMRFAGDAEAIDVRGGRFCDACRAHLPETLVASTD